MIVEWEQVLSTTSSLELVTAWINFPFDNKLAQQNINIQKRKQRYIQNQSKINAIQVKYSYKLAQFSQYQKSAHNVQFTMYIPFLIQKLYNMDGL